MQRRSNDIQIKTTLLLSAKVQLVMLTLYLTTTGKSIECCGFPQCQSYSSGKPLQYKVSFFFMCKHEVTTCASLC